MKPILTSCFLVFFTTVGFGQSLGMQGSYILDNHWITLSQNGQQFLTIGSLLIEGGRRVQGFEVRYSVLGSHGGHSPSRDIGDGQIVSNIDTEGVESFKIYELYVAKKVRGLEVSLGWRDLSTRYNVTDSALLFVNSSFGTTAEWGATGFRGPSIYPQISLGAHAWLWLTPNLYFGAAVVDPLTPENYYPKQLQTHVLLNESNHMAVSEVGYKKPKSFHIAFGGWNMEQAQRLSRPRFQQAGVYAMVSASIANKYHPFLRYGHGSERPGLIYANRVAGVNIQNAFSKKRDNDLGLGYTSAYLKGIKTPEEIYEMIYRYHYTQKLSLALSSQWVINPFFSNQDGQVLTLRIQIRSPKS